jgi:opacity protein-like surface antigen
MKNFALASGFCLLVVGSLHAQQEVQRFAFDIGGGFTQPVGNTGRQLDEGWNIGAGVGYNFSQYVGAMVDVGYNSFGIDSATLNNLGFPGGGVHIFSATLDPIVHLTPHSHFDLYLTGGGGVYHRNQDFTAPTVATVTGFDPFFGFFPVNVPTTEILQSYSVTKPGVDIGAGIAFGTKWHGKFFAEARYNRIFMGNNQHTDYIPVTFGFRW